MIFEGIISHFFAIWYNKIIKIEKIEEEKEGEKSMGVMVTRDEDDNRELTRKINADLREKMQRTQTADGEDPDFIEDSEFFEQYEKTGRFGWIWFVLVALALASLVFIILL